MRSVRFNSHLSASAVVRYGRDLKRTYATTLLASARTANPVAVEGGWYLFAGVGARYVFNQIFLDGNTFHDSRSIDYDPEQVAVSLGLAYSWKNLSMTFAINDLNVIGDEDGEVDKYSQYGTLTIAWRH